MPDLDVAIVIVSYKSAQLTINCLASISSERTTDDLRVRVIVVDNASGDLPEISRAVEGNGWSSWVSLLSAPRNGGFSYGNNLGIQLAYQMGPPDYVYLLNPDTEVRSGAIGTLARFLDAHPNVGVAGSGIDNPDGSDWGTSFRFPSLLSELAGGLQIGLVSRLLRRWDVVQRMSDIAQPVHWVSGASMMIRPALFAAIGSLDENYFLYFEETDLCFRARRAGFSTWYIPESRVMHVEGQSTRVNERTGRPRRLPDYWFESRRRYFVRNLGLVSAIFIDIVALAAHSLGSLKCLVLRRADKARPYFLRDLLRHSVLWPSNRQFPPLRTFQPKL